MATCPRFDVEGHVALVTGAVLYLASPAAAFVTGHTLLVDGGWTAR